MKFETDRKPMSHHQGAQAATRVQRGLEDWAFGACAELVELVRTKSFVARATEMYLGRLKKYRSRAEVVVTRTEERGTLRRPKQADTEIAAGKYRGRARFAVEGQGLAGNEEAFERRGGGRIRKPDDDEARVVNA